jgi:hypothetical protein
LSSTGGSFTLLSTTLNALKIARSGIAGSPRSTCRASPSRYSKGSGSNGIDTVYTVPSLPSVANAATATISVVPGFPTNSAKATGGSFTPFAVFFADATTMYVSDEGTGNAIDLASHAGLEKWSLVSGVWQLDYVLTGGLIGVVDSNLNGPDRRYPDVNTVGLRATSPVSSTAIRSPCGPRPRRPAPSATRAPIRTRSW